MMTNEKDKVWLIKSSSRVLGPYTLNEVIEKIRDKDVAVIDEVRTPQQRWTYIRDSILFLEVVKQVRDEIDERAENTHNSRTLAGSKVFEDTDDAIEASSGLEFKGTQLNEAGSGPNEIRDIEPVKVTDEVKNRNTSARSYVVNYDPKHEVEKNRSKKITQAIILIAIIVTGLSFYAWKKYQSQVLAQSNQNIIKRVHALNVAGLYNKAYDAYKSLPTNFVTTDLEVTMWPILLQKEKQILAVREAAKKHILKTPDRDEQLEGSILIALSYMAVDDLQTAKEYIERANAISGSSYYSKINEIILQIRNNELASAGKKLKNIYSVGIWGLNLYLRGQILLDFTKKSGNDFEAINEVDTFVRDSEEYFSKGSNFAELPIRVQMYILLTRIGKSEKALQNLDSILDSPLKEDSRYAQDILIDWSLFNQKEKLGRACFESFDEKSPDYKIRLGKALCQTLLGRDAEALQIIDSVQAGFGIKQEILNLKAQFLINQNDTPKLEALLKMTEWSGTQTNRMSQAVVAMQQNQEGEAKAIFDSLFENSNYSTVAGYSAGLALSKRSKSEALSQLQRVLDRDKWYIPALDLRDELEAQK